VGEEMECYGFNEFVDNTVEYARSKCENFEISVQAKNVRRNGSGGDILYDVHYSMQAASRDFEITQSNMMADKKPEVDSDLVDCAETLADRLRRALPDYEIENVANKVKLVSKDL